MQLWKMRGLLATLALITVLVSTPANAQLADGTHPLLRSAFASFQQQEPWRADGQLALLLHTPAGLAWRNQAQQLRGVLTLALHAPQQAEAQFSALQARGQPQGRAWLQLASVAARQGNSELASQYLSRIEGSLGSELDDERYLLTAMLALHDQQASKAVAALQQLSAGSASQPLVRYNLGVALLRQGELPAGIAVLTQLATQIASATAVDAEQLALRDRIAVGLGYQALLSNQPESARQHFDAVRLQGPYSNRALLGMGWAWLASNDVSRALPYWFDLSERDPGSIEVQEAWVAQAAALQQSGAAQQALASYQQADQRYEEQIRQLNAASATLRNEAVIQQLMHIVVADDWSLLNQPVLQPLRGHLASLTNDATLRALLLALSDLQTQHQYLLDLQQRLAALTPAYITKTRRGIRANAQPVTPDQQQRLAGLRRAMPGMLQRSALLQVRVRSQAAARLRDTLSQHRDGLRSHQAQARRGIAELYEQGLHGASP